MRVSLIAGPDAGHALPAFALAQRLSDSGHDAVVHTGLQWESIADNNGWCMTELAGLAPRIGDDDMDVGQKLHSRAGYMAELLIPVLREYRPEVVISDVLTACGGLAAELMGMEWLELNPHPLYLPSESLPPFGCGLAPGVTILTRFRDRILRNTTAKNIRSGLHQRAEVRQALGLPRDDPGPKGRLIATLPALELPRADWPEEAIVVGPLLIEPTDQVADLNYGQGPLIVWSPSTAHAGLGDLAQMLLASLDPSVLGFPVRLFICSLDDIYQQVQRDYSTWVRTGFVRQDLLLACADLAICGAGHGFLAKALMAGVPVVMTPGGGDQWELSQRVSRSGAGVALRPVTEQALTAAVACVLSDDNYRRQAQGMSRAVFPGDAVDIVENFYAGGDVAKCG